MHFLYKAPYLWKCCEEAKQKPRVSTVGISVTTFSLVIQYFFLLKQLFLQSYCLLYTWNSS